MRRVLWSVFTYLEIALTSLAFFVPLAIVAAVKRGSDPGMRLRSRWLRRAARVSTALTPIWRFAVVGDPPADIARRGYVVIANHESAADPLLLAWLPWDMRWVAKEELFRAPLVGWMLALGGDIRLRRDSRRSIDRMFVACRRTLAAGMPVMMFPEGTRSRNGRLGAFKHGAFKLAIDARAPLLLVAVAGTRDCWPKGALVFGKAEACAGIVGTLSTSGLSARDIPGLERVARARIQAGVELLRAELERRSEKQRHRAGHGQARFRPLSASACDPAGHPPTRTRTRAHPPRVSLQGTPTPW